MSAASPGDFMPESRNETMLKAEMVYGDSPAVAE